VSKRPISGFGETDLPKLNLKRLANPCAGLDWIKRKEVLRSRGQILCRPSVM
jgi:hypothetical protein